jgi:hypothetical protein
VSESVAIFKIKDFSQIDFLTVDAAKDVFILPNGQSYQCSDRMCDLCWTGGTVLESKEKSKQMYCVLCQNYLKKYTFKNDFLPPTGDSLQFYLPEDWSSETLNQWYEAFKARRIEQEKVREHILSEGME